MVRLEPSQKFSTSYTLSVDPNADKLRNSDTRNMVSGSLYEITFRKRKWRWMFEEEMGGDLSKEERGEVLRK